MVRALPGAGHGGCGTGGRTWRVTPCSTRTWVTGDSWRTSRGSGRTSRRQCHRGPPVHVSGAWHPRPGVRMCPGQLVLLACLGYEAGCGSRTGAGCGRAATCRPARRVLQRRRHRCHDRLRGDARCGARPDGAYRTQAPPEAHPPLSASAALLTARRGRPHGTAAPRKSACAPTAVVSAPRRGYSAPTPRWTCSRYCRRSSGL
jgi:hypothetical protein